MSAAMETAPPKPVITYFGDEAVLSAVLQKKLQGRLRQSQVHSLSKDEPVYSCFNAFCEGVEFLHFPAAKDRLKKKCPIYHRPALHTFWCSCYDAGNYRTHEKPLIKQWLDDITLVGGGRGGHAPAMSLIIYCVTAEVRARKQRPLLSNTSVEERLRADYKNSADDIIVFRLASSEESRLVESSQALVSKLNAMALAKFSKDIDWEKEIISRLEGGRCEPDNFYRDRFVRKLDLAVACEMTVQNELALKFYSEATRSLEDALTQFSNVATPPKWLESMRHAPCKTWDYPKLAWTQLSWRYLADIRSCSSPLLHTRTLLLVRVSHLLFVLDRAWSVSEEVINALHSMAREIKLLKLSFPAGAFDCWAYMACKEAIQAFMARISPDSLMAATSSLLLVRAELWHYALQKLHEVGVLCGLMPSSNKLNHDKVLIQQISSGITPVPSQIKESYDLMGVEDLGSELQGMLSDRKDFQREFLSLGEMVIGAFKHAGRRRMAFRVGTMIAQFHRDLGLMVEAEELLSDICKFYSEDQWMELSTKAYSLLADCQMKLRLEEKHINTMLLLASFPPYPAASHDPIPWLDRVIKMAQFSPYQKLLSWDPLLELVKLEGGGGGKKGSYVGDQVHLDLTVYLHAPKELKNLIVTIQTKLSDAPLSPAPNSTPSSGMQTPHKNHLATSPTLSNNSLANLDDLDLESGSLHPHSRPIGESSKHRSTSHVTHISHADITELEATWRHDEETSLLSFVVVGVNFTPGLNKVTLKGKGIKEGEFVPHKISVKLGALDFAYTVPASKAAGHTYSVMEHQVNVEVALISQESVFLASRQQDCTLSFTTSGDTSIPSLASVQVTSQDPGMLITLPTSQEEESLTPPAPTSTSEKEEEEEGGGHKGVQLHLPSLEPGEACQMGVILEVPAVNAVEETMCSPEETSTLVAWRRNVDVYCEWLTPPYLATLPVLVYEPLGLTCLEHCASGQSFLQLILANTCPVPLLVRHPTLNAGRLQLDSLSGNLPEVFYPQDSYSFLWQAVTTSQYIDCIPDKSEGSFEIEFSPLPADFDHGYCPLPKNPRFSTLHYDLSLSTMQTVFEMQLKVEASVDSASIVAHQPATLICTVTNITTPPPQETKFGYTPPSIEDSLLASCSTQDTPKIGYEVHVDKKVWTILGSGQGAFEMPAPLKKARLQFQVVPAQSGVLQLPAIQLHKIGATKDGRTINTNKSALTNAQVYDCSRGQLVTVHSEDLNTR